MSENWRYEDINCGDMGTVRITGDIHRVLLSVPPSEKLRWYNIPFKVHATWSLDKNLKMTSLDTWILGRLTGEDTLDDHEIIEVQQELESIMAEWLQDKMAQKMLSENYLASPILKTRTDEYTKFLIMEERKNLGSDNPYEVMDCMTRLAELQNQIESPVVKQ